MSYGIAGAFISGTKSSLLYDTLNNLDLESKFQKFNGRVLLYSYLVNAIVLLFIPAIYSINPKLPFLIGIGFFSISFIVSLFFVEPPMADRSKTNLKNYNTRFLETIKEIGLNKKLVVFILLSTVTAGFVFMSSEFFQPLLKISGLQVVYFGIVYSLMRVIMGFGGSITYKLEEVFVSDTLLYLGTAGIGFAFLGFSLGTGLIIIAAILLLKLFRGITRIVLEDKINKNIDSDNRTTILSLTSFSQSLFKAGIVFIFGITADIVGVQFMFNYVFLLFLILIATVIIYRKV